MRLTLIIQSLNPGGAERVMATMANYWAPKGWEITFLTFDDGLNSPFFELDPKIKHYPLAIANDSGNLLEGLKHNIKRLWVLRKAVKKTKPDAVISFIDRTNVRTLASTLGLSFPIVVSERIDPSKNDIGRVWSLFRRLLYPFASRLVVQTSGALSFFSRSMQKKSRIIPNPVIVPPIAGERKLNRNAASSAPKTLIAMGRLTEQKGFDILLRAFARVSPRHPEWNLVIWGEGEQRSPLEKLKNDLGLQDKVALPGVTHSAYAEMVKADLFVLSSRFEGFPMVLVESMVCGLPVISFDCPSGPKDIIQNEVDGLLIPSENLEKLAEAMDKLMGDEVQREKFSQRAPEVKERFGLDKVMGMWESLLGEVTS